MAGASAGCSAAGGVSRSSDSELMSNSIMPRSLAGGADALESNDMVFVAANAGAGLVASKLGAGVGSSSERLTPSIDSALSDESTNATGSGTSTGRSKSMSSAPWGFASAVLSGSATAGAKVPPVTSLIALAGSSSSEKSRSRSKSEPDAGWAPCVVGITGMVLAPKAELSPSAFCTAPSAGEPPGW